MKTKRIFVPRRRENEDEQKYLDNTGLGYEVGAKCPNDFKSILDFTISKWFADAKPLGFWYRCIVCWERSDDEEIGGIHLEKESGFGQYHVAERQRFGAPKEIGFQGYLCPACGRDQIIKNSKAHIPEPNVVVEQRPPLSA